MAVTSGCTCPTTRILPISNVKERLPDAWAHHTTVRDINISEPLNLSFHTKIVLTFSNSAAVAFSPLASVNCLVVPLSVKVTGNVAVASAGITLEILTVK